jgi:hypothetical protein
MILRQDGAFVAAFSARGASREGIGVGQSEEPEPRTGGLWELRPYEEAGAPSTGGFATVIGMVYATHRG